MIKKPTRYFNSWGPNIPSKHYTLARTELIEKGLHLVEDERYFTIRKYLAGTFTSSDLIVNVRSREMVIEFKLYRDPARFEKGKR